MSIVTSLAFRAAARALRRVTTAIVLVGFVAVAAPVRGEPSDVDFLAAKRAYDYGERTALASFASLFSGHLLEPYLAYWQLRLALDTATRDDVRAYLERWPDTPLADRLRVEWLKTLGNRAEWATFSLDYPPPAGEDTELKCYGIQYARTRDGESALEAAKPLWFNGQPTPDACEPLFAALINSNRISVADRRARFRLAIDAGNFKLAQTIADELPPAERIGPRDFARVDRDPLKALATGDFTWNRPGGRDLALYTLERAARADATAARAAWVRQRPRLPEADRGYGNARLAFHAARQLAPQANDWYREAAGVALTDIQRAWRVRAALRAGAWADVLAGIDAMPAPQAQEAAWRYWRARALAASGRKDDALALYATLATEPSFYGLLATEALGTTVSAAPAVEAAAESGAPSADALAAFGAKPGVRRAVALAGLSLKSESLREWIYAIRGLDDDGLLVASEYARRQKLYDRAINTAERTASRHDFTLRYLMPYREHFAAAARETEIDEAMLLGVARQESRFSTDIVSSAGAVGLMQLMPATARWVARQQGRSDFRPSDIGDVATNTQFGAYYLRYCLERLERLPALAFAAYNAGPNRAQQWRVGTPLEGAIWVETIPFNETRDYVKKVLANTMFYARALKQPYVPLSKRLGTITPRGEPALLDVGARTD